MTMKRIWFIIVDGKKEGPYTIDDLRSHLRITPFTLCWKKGFSKWIPMGSVKELSVIFEERINKIYSDHPQKGLPMGKGGEAVISETIHHSKVPFFWWFLLAILIILYAVYKLWFY